MTRERLTFALAVAAVVVAGIVIISPLFPASNGNETARLRFEFATATIAVAVAFALRRWPGVVAIVLILAVEPLGGLLQSAWWASQQLDDMGNRIGAAEPAFRLVFLSVLIRMTVPAAILALYATAPQRQLARWVTPVAGVVVLLTILAAVVRYTAEIDVWTNHRLAWTPQQELASDLDQPAFPWLLAGLGALGSLRAAALRHVTRGVPRTTAAGPSRAIIAAGAAVIVLWVPATVAFLGRVHSIDQPYDGSDRWLWLPPLLALVAIVASRWSRLAAWAAIAGAFQADALLTFYRGLAEIVALAIALGPDVMTPVTPGFLLLSAAGVLIQAFAFGALAVALRTVWREAADPQADVKAWLFGAACGIVICAWYIFGAGLTSGFPFSVDVLAFPAYPFVAALLSLGLWRRLVPAVAEAEAVATRPLRPLRYLEVVAVETISGGAENRRRAVEAERARLASALHAEFLPNLERLATRTAAGAPPEEVTERLRELQDEVRRLMSERRLVILEEFGIVEALEWLVGQAEERVSFAIELAIDEASTSDRPPREVERAAFRIAQLAVENAIQHAAPHRLALHVLTRSDRLTITVADDGRWVAPSRTNPGRDHVGIVDMRSEAEQVRGTVDVGPAPGGGTTVQFAWPAVAPASDFRPAPVPAPGALG